jgi:hypothetical protein
MKTDTPRTDEWETYCDECYYHLWRVRRKNERGFNDGYHVHNGDEAKALVDLLNKQDSELTAVTEQRDEALSDLEFRRDLYKLQTKILDDVREQRDELLRYNDEFRKETLICADCDAISKEEYDQAIEQRDKAWKKIENQAERITYLEGATNHATGTPLSKAIEQRDRLAEVLNRIANNNVQDLPETDYAYELGRMEGIAKIALQPLTTNELRYNHSMNMNEQVKDIILSYCQGIYHLEFDIEDLDEMVEKIIDNVTDQCG